MTPTEIAEVWLAAFNALDVDALLALYAEDATHTSPKLRALHPDFDVRQGLVIASRVFHG